MQTATSIKPRIAFAGVGWIGRHRMQAAATTGLATIVSVTDPSEECANEALKIASNAKAESSFEAVVNDPDVDAVVIATPSALHMEQAVYALEHGKAVFCQKPLGRTSEEVAQVIEAAEKNDKLLGADFSYRYTKAFTAVHEIIRTGELGQIFAAELKFHNAYGPGKPWFYDLKQAGGGCVLDLGVHLIDLLLYAFDFPAVLDVESKLYSKAKRLQHRTSVEDYADITLQLENNIHAHLSCSWNLHAGTEAIIEAVFYGTNGGVALKNINGSFYDFAAYRYRGTSSETISSPPDEWGGKAITDWLNKLSSSDRYQQDAASYVHSATVIDRIYGIN